MDDVVADAYAAVLLAMRNGNGPRENFRAYLLACVRNGAALRRSRTIASVDLDPDAAGLAFEDPERYVEADTVARAFAALSPRWQRALWLTEVEQRTVAEVGGELGLAPNAVAALTYRAREGFAAAYLSEHRAHAAGPACVAVGERLGAYVRTTASPTDVAMVEAHLATCATCRQARDELEDLNASLRSLQGPAAGAVAATATASVAGVAMGGFALAGTGALVKVAAVALLLTPAVALGAQHYSGSTTIDHRRIVTVSNSGDDGTPGAVVATAPSASGQPSDGAGARSGAGAPGSAATAPVGDPGAGQTGATPGELATTAAAAVADAGSTPPTSSGAPGATPGSTLAPGGVPAITLPPISLPPISTPPVTLPGVSLPAITVPSVSLPPVSTPAISTPPVTVAITLPPVTLPGLPLPPITVPPVVITVPSVTVPPITVPSVTVPSITVPSITLPPITVPSVTLPPITVPPVTIPPITVPGLG